MGVSGERSKSQQCQLVEKGKCRGCRKEKGIAGNEEEEWEL